MPIKCPVAPIEFLFLADDYFTRRGIRDRVELVYATPLDGAFTKPTCSRLLASLLTEKGISVETEFATGEVDAEGRKLRSYDDREISYDLLVTVPVHKGAAFLEASGLGNEMGFVPTDPHTLAAKKHDHVFALGDATDLPSSKAGSVAHFQAEVLEENLLRERSRAEARCAEFDGHANCFIESGYGKALADRLQLRDRAAARASSRCRGRPDAAAQGEPPQPLGKARLPAGSTGTPSCPAAASRSPAACRWRGKRPPAAASPQLPKGDLPCRRVSTRGPGRNQRRGISHSTAPSGRREVGEAIAREVGVWPLTERHWTVITFCREDAAREGQPPGLRRIAKNSGVDMKELYQLFPKGPGKLAARIAGLPKPTSCV